LWVGKLFESGGERETYILVTFRDHSFGESEGRLSLDLLHFNNLVPRYIPRLSTYLTHVWGNTFKISLKWLVLSLVYAEA
jgi:hypothetical protein